MGWIARFFLAVLIMTTAEFYLLLTVAQHLSALVTILLCVLTGVLGGAMVRSQGLRTLTGIQRALASGQLPSVEIVSGLLLLMMGTLLFTPGFITDTLAFLLLVPPIRRWAAGLLLARFKRSLAKRARRTWPPGQRPDPEDIVIEVEAEPVDRD